MRHRHGGDTAFLHRLPARRRARAAAGAVEATGPLCPSEATGPLCPSTLAVCAEASIVGECRFVLARMAAAELEPSGCKVCGAAAPGLYHWQRDLPGGAACPRTTAPPPPLLQTKTFLL